MKGQLDRKGRAGRGSQMCRGGGRQPGPITRGSQGPRCDGDTRRVSLQPTDRPVCSEAASPFLPEFKPSLACTRAWGWPTPSLTPDPARWVLSNPRRFNGCGSLTWAGSWVFGAGWVKAQHLEATSPHV